LAARRCESAGEARAAGRVNRRLPTPAVGWARPARPGQVTAGSRSP